MKGVIFNLFEAMVETRDWSLAWDRLLDATDLDGGYSAIGDYPDGELVALVSARASTADVEPSVVLRDFGQFALLALAERYPVFFTPHARTRDFLLTLNDVIHPEVRKLHAAATPPEFGFDTSRPDRLVITYRSQRRLCEFAQGMIQGAATHFGERVGVEQDACMHTGAEECVIRCTFGEVSGDDRGA